MKAELLAAVDRLAVQRIAVVGDLILDRYVWGNVERISPEAPVPVVEEVRREDRMGGAANVVHNLAGLGVPVDVYGVCGDDEAGQRLAGLLTNLKSDCAGIVIDPARPTSVKTRVLGGNQQMLRLDQEWRLPIGGDVEKKLLETFTERASSYSTIVVSDYGKGVVTRRLLEMLGNRKETAAPVVIDPNQANFDSYHGAYLLKPNKKEAEASASMIIHDVDSAFAAARVLLERWSCQHVLVTLGAMGMVLLGREDKVKIHLEARARQVFDVSGAGDCVTAIFAACLGKGIDWQLAGELANLAAGVVISEVGTVPIFRDKLLRAIALG
jgi:rfaE bifunctional protein kinase chain/domain